MISCCFRIHRILYLSGINMSSWNGDCGLWTLFQMRYKSSIGYAVSQSQTTIYENNLSRSIRVDAAARPQSKERSLNC